MIRKLVMLWGCVAMLSGAVSPVVAAEVGEALTSLEVTTLLADKTFFVKQLRTEMGANERVADYHVYFSPKGPIQITYADNYVKRGQWGVEEDGKLCLQFVVPAGSRNRMAKRCGVLVKLGPYDFARFNEKGVHLSTLTLVTMGNKFP